DRFRPEKISKGRQFLANYTKNCSYFASMMPGRNATLKTCARGRSVLSPKVTPIPMKPDHYDPIAAALKEDIGQGDATTDFFVPATFHATGRISARENAIVA